MDTEPDEIIITPEGAVQRWDRPDGMTFRLDVWPVDNEHDEEKEHDAGDHEDDRRGG